MGHFCTPTGTSGSLGSQRDEQHSTQRSLQIQGSPLPVRPGLLGRKLPVVGEGSKIAPNPTAGRGSKRLDVEQEDCILEPHPHIPTANAGRWRQLPPCSSQHQGVGICFPGPRSLSPCPGVPCSRTFIKQLGLLAHSCGAHSNPSPQRRDSQDSPLPNHPG